MKSETIHPPAENNQQLNPDDLAAAAGGAGVRASDSSACNHNYVEFARGESYVQVGRILLAARCSNCRNVAYFYHDGMIQDRYGHRAPAQL